MTDRLVEKLLDRGRRPAEVRGTTQNDPIETEEICGLDLVDGSKVHLDAFLLERIGDDLCHLRRIPRSRIIANQNLLHRSFPPFADWICRVNLPSRFRLRCPP